jgi:hypothetical protein
VTAPLPHHHAHNHHCSYPLSQPPKDLLIEVRVVKECGGKIMTDNGPISLDKGSIHFLKRSANRKCSVFFFLLC